MMGRQSLCPQCAATNRYTFRVGFGFFLENSRIFFFCWIECLVCLFILTKCGNLLGLTAQSPCAAKNRYTFGVGIFFSFFSKILEWKEYFGCLVCLFALFTRWGYLLWIASKIRVHVRCGSKNHNSDLVKTKIEKSCQIIAFQYNLFQFPL